MTKTAKFYGVFVLMIFITSCKSDNNLCCIDKNNQGRNENKNDYLYYYKNANVKIYVNGQNNFKLIIRDKSKTRSSLDELAEEIIASCIPRDIIAIIFPIGYIDEYDYVNKFLFKFKKLGFNKIAFIQQVGLSPKGGVPVKVFNGEK